MRYLLIGLFCLPSLLIGQIRVSTNADNASDLFAVVDGSTVTEILYDPNDEVLIEKAATFLAGDIEKVTGKKPLLVTSGDQLSQKPVIVGSIGHSSFIDDLIAAKKLNVDAIRGDWERFIIQTVKKPFPGIKEALVIAGSDRRGTAYGVFTLSEKIGVSPWHFWADVPAQQKEAIYLSKDRFVSKSPSVKYRGIFLNDEAPALTGWVDKTFGSFNHDFYETVFELLLRNKANYLWPAMWRPRAFAADDPLNPKVADEYGIVISTSHHEPMMRAHDEWSRYDAGAWNYETNAENLREFWRGGIERNGDYESVVTLGMRGDGDEAMSEETAVDLLQRIISDQRDIIEEVTDKPAERTPQVWAIYKEVQDYYDKGMRVDDDILVLFCDDNWGNVRILPKKEDLDHSGGYGMYYHFDFVGGPVSYRWLNVTQIERVWEQMNLSYEHGVQDLWIVNVGDLKPMELPISFFLDFAYDVEGIRAEDLPDYYTNWATQQFGPRHAEEIGEILQLYTKYNARRTPEMLKPDTYSLSYYREADRVLEDYRTLLAKSQKLYEQLPESQRAAFYQLVLSPVAMCSNLNEMYVAAGKNQLYSQQGRASANYYADQVKAHFFKDAALTEYFHDTLANGKWDQMMAQTHIGYTSWNNPPRNIMPEVTYIHTPQSAGLGYVVEHGEESRWSRGGLFSRSFSSFDPVNDQRYFLEIFNTGQTPLSYSLSAKNDWIKLSATSGTVQHEEKVYVRIDWNKAPSGNATGAIEIQGGGQPITIQVPIHNPDLNAEGFVENNGVISIEAPNFSRKEDGHQIHWTTVPNMGRTGSAITMEPANAEPQEPGADAPCLEYDFSLFEDREVRIETYLSPTLNYQKDEGLLFAIAVDDEEPQIINMHAGETKPDWEYPEWWNNSVTDHIKKKVSEHGTLSAGAHTLKVWMVDPGVVFQKFVIDGGGLKPSYLGPPASTRVENGGGSN